MYTPLISSVFLQELMEFMQKFGCAPDTDKRRGPCSRIVIIEVTLVQLHDSFEDHRFKSLMMFLRFLGNDVMK
jgi:hypothetical protein